jgi:hypothetical protein
MHLFISDISQVLFTRTKGSKNKRVKYRGQTYEISPPKPATQRGKKQQVTVRNISTGQTKTIAYGAKGYSDFRKHKDKARKDNYYARHSAIKLKDGSRAIDNPMQAAYHAAKQLW